MTIAMVSSKGQITLPSAARRAAGIAVHTRVFVEVRGAEIVVRPATDLMSLAGFAGKAMTRAAERAAMARGLASRRLVP